MVSRADISEQFSNFGIVVEDEVLEKCWEVCVDADVEADEFVETWMAYSVSRLGGADPTEDTVAQMERDEYGKSRNHIPSTPVASKKDVGSGLVVFDSGGSSRSTSIIETDILQGYVTTPKASRSESRLQSSPGDSNLPLTKRKSPARNSLNFSPASFSPKSVGTSAVYSKRENSGKVVCSYNISDKDELAWSKENEDFHPSVALVPLGDEDELPAKGRYMYDWLGHVHEILDDYVDDMGGFLNLYLKPWEPRPLDIGSKDLQKYLGRICIDGTARLNAYSVLLEGLADSTSNGRPLPVDLKDMMGPDGPAGIPKVPYAVFPGQVVVVDGRNDKGRRLYAAEIHSKATAPLPPPPRISAETGPLRIVIGTGPFTQMDSLSYQPLNDLVEYVRLHKPHVLILVGPFVDISHPQVSGEQGHHLAETFEEYFERMVERIMESLQGVNVQVVMVSNARDVHSQPIYPTFAYTFSSGSSLEQYLGIETEDELPQPQKLTMAPDPCFLDVGGVIIGVTSTDILMHLSREEVASNGHSLDRLARLSLHVVEQRNFYPLYPSDLSVNLDLKFWCQMCTMPLTPHLLVLPSDFRCFVKNIEGCVVINPERLTKGVSGGSFAKIEIHPAKEWEASISDQVKAQVLKI